MVNKTNAQFVCNIYLFLLDYVTYVIGIIPINK